MRDLCTLLMSWADFVPDDSSKNKLLCTTVVNTLIKFAADKTKMIFNTNICKLRPFIYMNEYRDNSYNATQMEEASSCE